MGSALLLNFTQQVTYRIEAYYFNETYYLPVMDVKPADVMVKIHQKSASSWKVLAVAAIVGGLCLPMVKSAFAGDANEDEMLEIYAVRKHDYDQRAAAGLPTLGCMGFTGATTVAQPRTPSPSPAAIPAKLRHHRPASR